MKEDKGSVANRRFVGPFQEAGRFGEGCRGGLEPGRVGSPHQWVIHEGFIDAEVPMREAGQRLTGSATEGRVESPPCWSGRNSRMKGLR